MLESIKSSVRHTLVYGLGALSSKLVGFILIPLYTSYFSVAEYGVIGMIEVTATAVISIFGLALYQALFRWYWDKDYSDRQGSILFTVLTVLLLVVFLINIVAWVLDSEISLMLFDSEKYRKLVKVFIAAAGLQILIVVVSSVMQLQQKSVLYTITSLAMLLVQLVMTLFLIIYFNKGIEAIYYAQIAGSLLYFVITARFIILNIVTRFEKGILYEMLIYSFPLIISNIAALTLSLADRYLIRIYGTMNDLGVYQFAYKIANTLQVVIVASAGMALKPLMLKKMNDDNAKRFYSKVLTYSAFILMYLVLFVTLFGYEAVKLIAKNKEYWHSYAIIPVVSFGIFFGMLKDNVMIGLQILKKTRVISLILISIASFSLLLNLMVIPTAGYKGAAMVFLISQVIFFVSTYMVSQRIYHVKYEIRKILIILTTGIMFWALSYLVHPLPFLIRMIFKFSMLFSFPFILYFMSFFEQIEVMHLRSGFLKWGNPLKLKSNILAVMRKGKKKSGKID